MKTYSQHHQVHKVLTLLHDKEQDAQRMSQTGKVNENIKSNTLQLSVYQHIFCSRSCQILC